MFVKVKAQMFHSHVLQHKAVTPVSRAEPCSYSRADPSRPLLPGAGCLQSLPHHTEMFQKSSGCTLASGDGDGFTLSSLLRSTLTLWVCWEGSTEITAETFPSAPRLCCALCKAECGALTAGNSTSLQAAALNLQIPICLMALKTAERSGLTVVSPGFKFSRRTCKYLLLTSNLLF